METRIEGKKIIHKHTKGERAEKERSDRQADIETVRQSSKEKKERKKEEK